MSVSSLMKTTEVADAASASARASGNNDSNKCPAARLSWGGAVAMSATSLLFAWLAAGTLRRCGAMDDEEEVFSGVLWGLSPLIWAYLYSWTAALSPARSVDGTVFKATACLLLLAAAADKLIAPVAGAVAIVLAPLLSACACGRALAERLIQRAGAEPWSAAAVASTPLYQSRAEEAKEREDKVWSVFVLEIMAFALSATVWLVSWDHPKMEWEAPTADVVFYLAGPVFLAARLMLPCMARSPVLAAIDDMRAVAAMIGFVGWIVVVGSATLLFGTIAGTVVAWMGELGMAGFVGYFLAVEAHYEELMVIKRKEPRRPKDASGLLDGRDSGDACSAHIDIDAAAAAAADCLCLDSGLLGSCSATRRS